MVIYYFYVNFEDVLLVYHLQKILDGVFTTFMMSGGKEK